MRRAKAPYSVNGPYTTIHDNMIEVWVSNQPDAGLLARKPSEVPPPDKPSGLRFKFPNVWQNNINEKLCIIAVFAPIDEENTMMYVRFYHNFTKNKLLRGIIGITSKRQNNRILAEDEAIVVTQQPKKADLDVGERFIPGDRPIALYLQRRRELMLAADHAAAEKSEGSQEKMASIPVVTLPVTKTATVRDAETLQIADALLEN